MALVYTTWAQWSRKSESEARLKMFSRGEDATTHPNVEAAEGRAIEEMIGYLEKRYGPTPLDNISPLTLDHLLNLGLWHLTDFSEARPENITKNAETSRRWLEKVANGSFVLKTTVSSVTSSRVEGLPGIIFRQSALEMDGDSATSLLTHHLGRPL